MLDNTIEIYSQEEFASMLNVTTEQLRKWATKGVLEPCMFLNTTLYYTNKQSEKAKEMLKVN